MTTGNGCLGDTSRLAFSMAIRMPEIRRATRSRLGCQCSEQSNGTPDWIGSDRIGTTFTLNGTFRVQTLLDCRTCDPSLRRPGVIWQPRHSVTISGK
jgi:hypothetical protein